MVWTEDLAVGNDTIDEQHRELIVRINDLVAAIKQSTCKYKISDVITFLEDYVVFHFGEEEKLMEKYDYPAREPHRAQHRNFIGNLAVLKKELIRLEGGKKRGSYDLSVETNHIVVDWILDHIAKTDKQLGKFLQQKDA